MQVRYPCGCLTELRETGQFHVKQCTAEKFGLPCWSGFEVKAGDWLDLPVMKGLYHGR